MTVQQSLSADGGSTPSQSSPRYSNNSSPSTSATAPTMTTMTMNESEGGQRSAEEKMKKKQKKEEEDEEEGGEGGGGGGGCCVGKQGAGVGVGVGVLLSGFFHRYRKYFVVLGGILVYIPIGVPWYFGNLAAYLASYFRHHDTMASSSDVIVDPQWIFSAFFVAFSLAIVLSGYMANSIGTRPTVFVAILVHSGATFLSYFATQHSMEALIITFGAVGGLGAGLAYGPPMPAVSKWLPRHVGVASGVLLTGFGGGAVIYNELITIYINPTNIQPDVTTERTSYFSQPEVLNKIPEVFLVLGAITLALQLLGLLLIRDPREGDEIEEAESLELKPIVTKDAKPTGELTEVDLQSDSTSQTALTEAEAASKELSPLDVLKQKDFYLLWLALGLNHYGYVIKNNYYKEFGAARVDNDHLLTTIGTVSTIVVAVSRLCWGVICDVIGIKLTVMCLLGSTSVLSCFWYFTLMAGPGLYFLWTVLVSWVLAGAFIIFPLAALSLFGQRHYATNYGLISTVQIVVNLVSPPVIRALLESHGWYAVFISIAASNMAGTIAALFLAVT